MRMKENSSNGFEKFLDIVSGYYPKKEFRVQGEEIFVNGYLAQLVECLVKEQGMRRFTFLKYLIEHVKYTEALEKTDEFIRKLVNGGFLLKDNTEKDLYRMTDAGSRVLRKVYINKKSLSKGESRE